jgi:tetratricopeptide (TPR) repeat protein
MITAVVVVTAGIAGAVYDHRQRQQHHQALQLKMQGSLALERGDYKTALVKLSSYVQQRPVDAGAYIDFARAMMNRPQPGKEHREMVFISLGHALAIAPDDRQILRSALPIYLNSGQYHQVIEIADRLQKKLPDDHQAICARSQALQHLGLSKQALKDAISCARQNPDDLEAHVRVLNLQHAQGVKASLMINQAMALHDAHPDDARFVLLMSIAFRLAGEQGEAALWLKRAADHQPVDPTFVKILLNELDEAGHYDQSVKLVRRWAMWMADSSVSQLLISRLWQRGQYDALTEHLAHADGDADLLSWYGLALLQSKRYEEVRAITVKLHQHADDPVAMIWARVLEMMMAEDDADPRDMLEICEQAMLYRPKHPALYWLTGEAWSRLGENALAKSAWRQAAKHAPAWALPYRRMAQVSLLSGYKHHAAIEAIKALDRNPDDLLAQACHAVATGDIERMKDMINHAEMADAQLLFAMADANETIAPHAIRRLRSKYGMTSQLAYAMAVREKSKTALEQFDQLCDQDNLDWQIQRARLLEAINHGRAASTWTQLADQYVDHLPLQRLAVKAESTQDDRMFIDRAINRIRGLTGRRGITWRLARGRYCLAGGTDEDLFMAAPLLHEVAAACPQLIEVNILLADCLESIGSRDRAADRVRIALKMDPENEYLKQRLMSLQ